MPSPPAEQLECWPRVRLWLGRLAAWYLPLVYRLQPVAVPGNQLRLRRDWTLEIGADLADVEVTALVVELCDHIERNHLDRRGDRDPAVWAQAARCESVGAWEDLLAGEMGRLGGGLRATFPRDTPRPSGFGLPVNLRAEEYYDHFQEGIDEALALFGPYGPQTGTGRPHEPEPGRGLPGPGRRSDGPGMGDGRSVPGGEGDHPKDGSGADERPSPTRSPVPATRPGSGVDLVGSEAPDRVELEPVVKEVESEMRRAAPGTLPAELERRVRRGARPEIAWRRELARMVGQQPGRHDYSILPRPNYARLLATGALGSRLQVGHPRVTVLRDASASMDASLLRQALAEVEEIARHGPDLLVVDADTEVHNVRQADADLERFVGGGGTDMVGAAWEAWRRTRPDCLVVLTDGQTPWDERTSEPPGTIWVIIGRGQPYVPGRFRSVLRIAPAS